MQHMRTIAIVLAWLVGTGIGLQIALHSFYLPDPWVDRSLRASECAQLCYNHAHAYYGHYYGRNITVHSLVGCDVVFSMAGARPSLGVVAYEEVPSVIMRIHKWGNYTYRAECRRNITA